MTPLTGIYPLIFCWIWSSTMAWMIETPSESLNLAAIFDFLPPSSLNCFTSITYKQNTSFSLSSVSQIRLTPLLVNVYYCIC
jgi:hypothetical protein